MSMIPEAAIEAAVVSLCGDGVLDEVIEPREAVRAALEAAAPMMLQAHFLEINLRAVEEELRTPWRAAHV